jgi:hypothetical protein
MSEEIVGFFLQDSLGSCAVIVKASVAEANRQDAVLDAPNIPISLARQFTALSCILHGCVVAKGM